MPQTPDAPPSPRPAPTARPGAGRVLATAAGGVVALVAVALVIAGGALLWADGRKDADGYIAGGTERFTTSAYAIATENLDIDADVPAWVVDPDRYGTVRLRATPRADKDVFVGIARTRDVAAYLGGSARAMVTDLDYAFRPSYRAEPGDRRPAPPAGRDIWAASATGAGTQELTWDVTGGDWSVVVMNADGSRGVDAGVSAGAKVPLLDEVAWGTLGSGLVLLVAAGGLLFVGLRTPRPPRPRRDGPGLTPATA